MAVSTTALIFTTASAHFVACRSSFRNCLAHSVNQRTAKTISQTQNLNAATAQNHTFWTKGQSTPGPHRVSNHAGWVDMTARQTSHRRERKPTAVSAIHHAGTAAALTFFSNASLMPPLLPPAPEGPRYRPMRRCTDPTQSGTATHHASWSRRPPWSGPSLQGIGGDSRWLHSGVS